MTEVDQLYYADANINEFAGALENLLSMIESGRRLALRLRSHDHGHFHSGCIDALAQQPAQVTELGVGQYSGEITNVFDLATRVSR